MTYRQLTLDFGQGAGPAFDSFCPEGNEQLHARLSELARHAPAESVFVWGERGVGKSHLLQALAQAASAADHTAIIVDGGVRQHLQPEMLQGLADLDVVCIDELDAFLGDAAWEEALFHLYNQLQGRATLVVAASQPPHVLPVGLADLKSRWSACEIHRLRVLPEAARAGWFQQAARLRGVRLERDVIDYIFLRAPRHMSALVMLLDRIDAESLVAGRAVTVPFIREIMEW